MLWSFQEYVYINFAVQTTRTHSAGNISYRYYKWNGISLKLPKLEGYENVSSYNFNLFSVSRISLNLIPVIYIYINRWDRHVLCSADDVENGELKGACQNCAELSQSALN